MRVSTKWFIFLTGVVSTTASLLGGYLMWTEGLRILELTVDQSSSTDVVALGASARLSFSELVQQTKKYATVLDTYSELNSIEGIGSWLRIRAFSDMRYSDLQESAQILGIELTNHTNVFQELTWYDPLVDGSRQYVNCYYDHTVNTTECASPCVLCYSVDINTVQRSTSVYNYTNAEFQEILNGVTLMDAATPPSNNVSYWGGPSMWEASDGNTFVYISYNYIRRGFQSNPLLKDFAIMIIADFLTEVWASLLEDYVTEAHLLLTNVYQGLNSSIFAGNFPEAKVVKGCTIPREQSESKDNPCLRLLRQLPPAVQDVALRLNRSEANEFVRGGTRGGEHWMRYEVIHDPTGADTLKRVVLFWFRSVASVESEMESAFFLFVGFVVVVFVFDLLIGVSEIILISRPLALLAKSIEPLNRMDLEEAESIVTKTPYSVKEVGVLQDGLLVAMRNLAEYKAYIPESLFDDTHSGGEVDRYPPCVDGCAAIVFTDIQASTSTWEECPGGMKKALKIHNQIIRDCIQDNSGYEVKTIGDAFMVAFDTPKDAVTFATETQVELLAAEWPADLLDLPLCQDVPGIWRGLRIRIGVHYGEVELEQNPLTGRTDYLGPTVNKAARVEAASIGGAVAVTQEVFSRIDMPLKERGISHLDIGGHQLRGTHGDTQLHLFMPDKRKSAVVDMVEKKIRSEDNSPRHGKPDQMSSKGSLSTTQSAVLCSSGKDNSVSFSSRTATVGCISIDYSMMVSSMCTEPLEAVNTVLSILLQVVERCNGCIVNVANSSIAVSWGAPLRCVAHQQNGLRAVGLFYHQLTRGGRSIDGCCVGVGTGQVYHGHVGTKGQKYIMVIGSAVALSERLAEACRKYRNFNMVASMPSNIGVAPNPTAKGLVRPMAEWKIEDATVTVCEVRASVMAKNMMHMIFESTTMWDWGAEYIEAFNKKDIKLIRERCSDPSLLVVADSLEAEKYSPLLNCVGMKEKAALSSVSLNQFRPENNMQFDTMPDHDQGTLPGTVNSSAQGRAYLVA